jgi:hypothetical protein
MAALAYHNYLSPRLQRDCRADPPSGERFDAPPAGHSGVGCHGASAALCVGWGVADGLRRYATD